MEEGPMLVETLTEQAPAQSQPTPAPSISPASGLDDAAVRAAIAQAEAQGRDPEALRLADLSIPSQPQANQAPTALATQNEQKLAVPEKFLKTDGEVDVDKLKASTEQLREAVQEKEQKIQKTAEDYIAEYRALEKRLRESPNPDKLAANLPPPQPAPAPPSMTNDQLKQVLAEDFQRDFVGTTTDLIDAIVNRKLSEHLKPIAEPIKQLQEERQDLKLRDNLKKIAAEDPRISDPRVFAAINAKLQSEPELWNLKNPHRAAWLEVKEELRLGELQKGVQAQPSRPSPILGGGTPASTPSSSSANDPRSIVANLNKLDPSDKKQEALGDAAIRALIQGR